MTFSPDGKTLASSSWDYSIKLCSVANRALVHTFEGHKDYVYSVDFSSDGKLLASGSYDRTAKLWSIDRRALVRTFEKHTDFVYSVAFSPDDKLLASGSYKLVKLWSVNSGQLLATIPGFNGVVTEVAWKTINNISYLLTSSADKAVRLWQVKQDGDQLWITLHWISTQTVLTIVDMLIQDVAFSPMNTRLLKQ